MPDLDQIDAIPRLAQVLERYLLFSLCNSDGTILHVNSAFERISGYRNHELEGRDYWRLTAKYHSSNCMESIWSLCRSGQSWEGELRHEGRGGAYFWLQLFVIPLHEVGQGNRILVLGYDVTSAKEKLQRNELSEHYDSLTALPDRILFHYQCSIELSRMQQNSEWLSVLYFNFDHFNAINESAGYYVGDQFLRQKLQRLRLLLTKRADLYRYVGDKFLILLKGLRTKEELIEEVHLATDIIRQVESVDHYKFAMTASVGIAVYPEDGSSAEELLRNAEVAMFQAKKNGRNQYRFFSSQQSEQSVRKIQLQTCLKEAIAKGELKLFYQPKKDLTTNLIYGAEALLRWDSDQLGCVSPDEVIPLAEEMGLIHDLGDWVLQQVCRQLKEWELQGFRSIVVSVNVSTKQLLRSGFAERVREILEQVKLDTSQLELEITESSIMTDPEKATVALNEINSLGITVSIDDFGTGFSSLSYLQFLEIDTLKIDRSFIRDLTTSIRIEKLTRSIIRLGKTMGLKVIAEGVETEEQVAMLRRFKCNAIQGYWIDKPLEPVRFSLIYLQQVVGMRSEVR